MDGKPANNVLLTGSRGTGKSSLVKACLSEYHSQGLKLIEIDKENIGDLPEVIDLVSREPGRFILFGALLPDRVPVPGVVTLYARHASDLADGILARLPRGELTRTLRGSQLEVELGL